MKLATAKVHFIGIGGIGMCGLAELLHNMGATVTGSDLSDNPQTARLKDMGIKIYKGHAKENLGDAEVVVYSSAVKAHNEEYRAARERKIPLIPRAEALAEMMRLKRGIAVAGTHGKTTTTSFTASVFMDAKVDPTIVVGGRLDLIKSTAQLGKGDWLIAEADESDGSFNRLSPEIVIITNIDNDHLDHYGSFEALENAFLDFSSRIPFYGSLIVCGDDPKVRDLFKNFSKRILYYGFDEANDYVLKQDSEGFSLLFEGEMLGRLNPSLPGKHNALNASAAVIAGLEAGLDLSVCLSGVEKFRGVDRRFQWKMAEGGVDHYDDYGHHPTEIRAVLSGFRDNFPDRRLVVLFQPHRYSRTQICWDDFLKCFKDADTLFVMDIYAAGEKPIPGYDSMRLAKEIEHDRCEYLADPLLSLVQELKEGDVFVTLGAGNVWKLGEDIMAGHAEKSLKREEANAD